MTLQSEPPDMWARSPEGDTVAAVSPADLQAVWKLMLEAQGRNPGEHMAIANTVYQSVCSLGADVMSVYHRVCMVWMPKVVPDSPLAPWTHDGQFDDVVFEVAATFPMKKMAIGVVYDGPPFDVEEFVKQIGARTQG